MDCPNNWSKEIAIKNHKSQVRLYGCAGWRGSIPVTITYNKPLTIIACPSKVKTLKIPATMSSFEMW
jgi:hypothetical protein